MHMLSLPYNSDACFGHWLQIPEQAAHSVGKVCNNCSFVNEMLTFSILADMRKSFADFADVLFCCFFRKVTWPACIACSNAFPRALSLWQKASRSMLRVKA